MSSNQNNLIVNKGENFPIQNCWKIVDGYERTYRKHHY